MNKKFIYKYNKKKKIIIILAVLLLILLVTYFIKNKYSADTVSDPTYFGCENTIDAKCIHLINNTENGITIDTPANLGTVAGTFRPLLTKKTIIVSVPAFDVDASGFPLSDMILEVKYKDTIASTSDPVQVFQRIDYGSSVYQLFPSLAIGETGLGDTKIKQTLFEKENWQRLRSINGNFIFKFTGGSSDLPIEYIAVTRVSSADAEAFKKWQRDSRGLVELPHIETNTPPSFTGDFATYISSTSKQIFPNSIPAIDEIDKDINISTALGEYEPIPISIYTKKDLSNVSVVISDLASTNGTISKNNIQVDKVVYDYKYWSDKYQSGSAYGLQPDRIEKFDKINIESNTSQQFWLTAAISKDIAGGVYSGVITVTADRVAQKNINVKLDILPITLHDSKQINAVYHSPKSKNYSLNNAGVYADMKAHEINSVTAYSNGATINITNRQVIINTDIPTANLKEYVDDGVVKKTLLYLGMKSFYPTIISKLDAYYRDNPSANIQIDGETLANNPPWANYGTTDDLATNWKKISDQRFKKIYIALIKQLISDGKNVNLQNGGIDTLFQVVDEPGVNKERRAYGDLLYRYIKEAGGKTWATYYDSCRNEVPCPECLPCSQCAVKDGIPNLPSMADLIDYKTYAMYYINSANATLDKDSFGFYDTTYSQIRNPIYNRFIHGLFAEKTGAKVTAIYAYGDYSSDPYNDFDPGFTQQNYYDFLLAYPTWSADGEMIPTMAWEGLREGIKDDKYIETLRDLISKHPDQAKAKEADAYLNSTLNKISMDWQTQYTGNPNATAQGFDKVILKTVSKTNSPDDYAAFDDIRNTVIQYIKDLYVPPPYVPPPTPPTPDPTPDPTPPPSPTPNPTPDSSDKTTEETDTQTPSEVASTDNKSTVSSIKNVIVAPIKSATEEFKNFAIKTKSALNEKNGFWQSKIIIYGGFAIFVFSLSMIIIRMIRKKRANLDES